MCVPLYTTVVHKQAENSSDNFPFYPPDTQNCSDNVYGRDVISYVDSLWTVNYALLSRKPLAPQRSSRNALNIARKAFMTDAVANVIQQ